MSEDNIEAAITGLTEVSSKDTSTSSDFLSEFYQFIIWYKEQSKANYNRVVTTGKAQKIFRLLHTTSVYTVFPNTEVALRIYLSLMATSFSGERSFSQLERIKNVKRSTTTQRRLGVLALLSIESDLLQKIDFSSLIDKFSTVKARKVAV